MNKILMIMIHIDEIIKLRHMEMQRERETENGYYIDAMRILHVVDAVLFMDEQGYTRTHTFL